MEQSLSSLAFRGSIAEAITEAKLQKKLFVVYTSGDNPESKHLETSTWIDPKVSEILSKYCILLHILEGSSEASNFSAIYPQHSVPCITAIGYNGLQLWQKEGFVSADALASGLEKAWLSLHVQETTAAFLSAALSSGKQFASGTSVTASSSEQVTPGTYMSTQSTDGDILSPDAGQPLHSDRIALDNNEDASKETHGKQSDTPYPEPSLANVNGELDKSISKTETERTSKDSFVSQNDATHLVPQKNLDLRDDNSVDSSNEVPRETANDVNEVAHVDTEDAAEVEKANTVNEVAHVDTEDAAEVEKANASDFSTFKSSDVFLNIKLFDGSSLQVKYSLTDTLKMVKDYIIENQTSSLGSFSIAIPYPRKVFNDQDMDSTLSELGLYNRQALIVVPHNQNNSHHRGGSSQHQTYSSNDASSSNGSEGYWASARRILSYVNPLSYLSRSENSPSAAQEPQPGIWQYGPNAHNPSMQSSNQGTTPSSSNTRIRPQTSRFGANIHTLKHEDDDGRFDDRNAFWNGNSTQYGSNDDGSK